MIEFESIGFPDAGYARAYTERFIVFVDGVDVGIKDEWCDGKIFSQNPLHTTFAFDCPRNVIPELQKRWDCDEDEGEWVVFHKDLSESEIREVVLSIGHLSKRVA